MIPLWNDILTWWNSLWTDPKIFGAAIGGLVTGLVLLLLGETWKHRSAESKWKKEHSQSRLDQVYGPLYSFYRGAYARFEAYKRDTPDTQTERQAFFGTSSEDLVGRIISERTSYASQALIEQWVALSVAEDRDEQQRCRASLVRTLIKEYQGLRCEIGLDYSRGELRAQDFIWESSAPLIRTSDS